MDGWMCAGNAARAVLLTKLTWIRRSKSPGNGPRPRTPNSFPTSRLFHKLKHVLKKYLRQVSTYMLIQVHGMPEDKDKLVGQETDKSCASCA
jgi:hypothetical protein